MTFPWYLFPLPSSSRPAWTSPSYRFCRRLNFSLIRASPIIQAKRGKNLVGYAKLTISNQYQPFKAVPHSLEPERAGVRTFFQLSCWSERGKLNYINITTYNTPSPQTGLQIASTLPNRPTWTPFFTARNITTPGTACSPGWRRSRLENRYTKCFFNTGSIFPLTVESHIAT